MKYDVVIKNGTIIDPKRRKSTIANLGILNGKISSITREEIRDVAKKYLNSNQRMILDYVPAKDKAQN